MAIQTTPAVAGASAASARDRDVVPLWRLYALRAGYLLLVIGLGVQVWPGIVLRHDGWELMEGVVQCMLGAMGLLAVLGLRHPLKMLPLLLFEIVWKLVWLGVVAAPRLLHQQMDAGTWSTLSACLLVVVFPIVIPWRYAISTFMRAPADRWR
ncbi:hypothetical protein ACP93_11975 [Xanthomonas sp. NCPPB 1128]|uniref:hypothetical protein n=1 Tax=Xanthomonas sp. NCPPB 1128 TaxID=1775876 RepID=UPI00065AF9AE|nr:hypothetical protein [Xanthomonas sp. NCPPB 1128]KMM75379.1 hypothetical protein ACP93_11975 [Xanthomonas sp. NCPPB 1128]